MFDGGIGRIGREVREVRRPAEHRSARSGLFLVMLAALLTVLAGPCAAAQADPATGPAPSVQGISPNGEDAIATLKTGQAQLSPAPLTVVAVPAGQVLLPGPHRAGVTAEATPRLAPAPAVAACQSRAPPARPHG
jgi:hypothetical protein